MKKIIFLLCLVFGVGLSANTASEVKANVETNEGKTISFKAGKNKVLEHTYYKNGSLKSFDIARTDVQRGTYTEYYENGNLKSFIIIK